MRIRLHLGLRRLLFRRGPEETRECVEVAAADRHRAGDHDDRDGPGGRRPPRRKLVA